MTFLGQLLSSAPFFACAAVVSIKSAAFNLLPIPPLNGSQIVQSLLVPDAERVWLNWAANFGALAVILIIVSYGLALGLCYGSPKHEAAEQGDEADEAGASDGASQLIPSVRRT